MIYPTIKRNNEIIKQLEDDFLNGNIKPLFNSLIDWLPIEQTAAFLEYYINEHDMEEYFRNLE